MDLTNYVTNQNAGATAKTMSNNNSTSKSGTKDSYEMGMKQFLSLMVAQLKNQDMMNPTSDTEFVSQMAQFTSLQAVANLEETVTAMQATYMTSYATSLMGKNVVVATLDENNEVTTVEGVVTGVTLFEGQPIIYIGDKGYTLSQIMVVGDAGKNNKPGGGGDEETDKDDPKVEHPIVKTDDNVAGHPLP